MTEASGDEMEKTLKEVGLTIDKFSGSIGRLVFKNIQKQNDESIRNLFEEE